MDQNRRRKLFAELVELAEELVGEVLQKLSYYRASVYKGEAADSIELSVERLRNVVDHLSASHPAFAEIFADYDTLAAHPEIMLARYPGECTLSIRIAQLTQDIRNELKHLDFVQLEMSPGALEDLCVLRSLNATGTDI